jgi:arabinose-5-phosphate isomerase
LSSSKAKHVDLAYARTVIRCEAQAVASLESRIGEAFTVAGDLILGLTDEKSGRVVVAGMGKAGVMGQKIAATFASTGTPALFMHPAEAVHGDLGMVTKQDVVIAVSNSGETEELLRLLPTLKQIGCKIITITASKESSLGRASNVVLDIGKLEEPCPLRMAPSASTTAMLAMGDALALAVLKARGFTQEDFALLHPAGSIGRRLMKVSEAMRSSDRMVTVAGTTTVGEALALMAKPPRNGAAVIAKSDGTLAGIFTHGDFARLVLKHPQTIQEPISKHMTSPCKFVLSTALVMDAQQIMHDKRINALPVVDDAMNVLGLLDIQDLV